MYVEKSGAQKAKHTICNSLTTCAITLPLCRCIPLIHSSGDLSWQVFDVANQLIQRRGFYQISATQDAVNYEYSSQGKKCVTVPTKKK